MVYASVGALMVSALAVLLGYPALAAISAGIAQLIFSSLDLQLLVAHYA